MGWPLLRMRTVAVAAVAGVIALAGLAAPAWGAQLEASINPDEEFSPFKMTYQRTIFIEYPQGGMVADVLRGAALQIDEAVDPSHPDAAMMVDRLNAKIRGDGSAVVVSDLGVSYRILMNGLANAASLDLRVIVEGRLSNYVIVEDGSKKLVDMGWRALSLDGPVKIDGTEINIPMEVMREQYPQVYEVFAGTEAEAEVLSRPLIDADFILEQPLTNWHFLFDPTGIGEDAALYGLDESIAGKVISRWTMGESSIREGRQVELEYEATVTADQTYRVHSIQSADSAVLGAIGFGAIDVLDGVEIIGLSPNATGSGGGGGFSITIIYGMAGLAAVAGIGFFIFSNRSLKREQEGQQGIDPTRLVGLQTSSSSGGYQTNRGEAQLRDDTGYQQTRSVYEQDSPAAQPAQDDGQDAACGCAASAEMGSECDCEMQGSCLCDATCGCGSGLCREHSGSME